MIDFMYGRGEVMLYPNAPGDTKVQYTSLSFSTTFMERGEHSATDGKVEKRDSLGVGTAGDALKPSSEWDLRKTVPLLRVDQAWKAQKDLASLNTDLAALPVLSLRHRRVTGLAELAATGREFIESGRKSTRGSRSEYAALTEAWLDQAPEAPG